MGLIPPLFLYNGEFNPDDDMKNPDTLGNEGKHIQPFTALFKRIAKHWNERINQANDIKDLQAGYKSTEDTNVELNPPFFYIDTLALQNTGSTAYSVKSTASKPSIPALTRTAQKYLMTVRYAPGPLRILPSQ